MPRPDFVSNEDFSRWEDMMRNDTKFPSFIFTQPIILEVCFAGLWFAEELQKLGCPQDMITTLQYTGGRLSFGSDPWEVHQALLDDYKNGRLEFQDDDA